MTKRRLNIIVCVLPLLVGVATADDAGWFLEPPANSIGAELGNEMLLPQDQIAQLDALSLQAGYQFNAAFSLSAVVTEIAIDNTPGRFCLDADFTCIAARQYSLEYATGYALSLIPALQLHDDLALYGRLGVQGWDLEGHGDSNVTTSDLLFGIGVGYDISNPLRLQLEYRSLDLDIKLTSIGFSWRF